MQNGFDLGGISAQALIASEFLLDGGAMFGSMGKPLWSHYAKADEANRIPLVLRVLLLRFPETAVLVETGMGRAIGAAEAERLGIGPPTGSLAAALERAHVAAGEIEHIILTHLHFDHVAALAEAPPPLPEARVYVQKIQWDAAMSPSRFEESSFRAADIAALRERPLVLLDGPSEILPGLEVRPSDGHTDGLQVVVVRGAAETLYFASDLIPTLAHVRSNDTMGFDHWPERLIAEKLALLEEIASARGILVFVHDPRTPAGRIAAGLSGFHVAEKVSL